MIVSISADPVARAELSLFVTERRADIAELQELIDAGHQERATEMAGHIAHTGELSGQVVLGLIAQRLHNALRLGYNKIVEPALKELSQYLDSLEDELAQKCA